MSIEDGKLPLVTPLVDKFTSPTTSKAATKAADAALDALDALLQQDTTGEGVEINFDPQKKVTLIAPKLHRRIGRAPYRNKFFRGQS